ncbi:hypothetical protein C8R45DRAFT_1157884 [Mycena sanguinolenta]|nr:hypothetical protein C8R45DRAFT_1157884 [Mycena sanguinolenta]
MLIGHILQLRVMDTEAEQEICNASAARLKELKALRSAARTNPLATNRRGQHTVVIGSSSSGRVTTRMIGNFQSCCYVQKLNKLPASCPLRPNNSQEEPLAEAPPPVASTPFFPTGSSTSAAGGVPDYDTYSSIQYFPKTRFNFNFNAFNDQNFGNDPAWPGVRNDLAWLNSLNFDPVPAASNAGDHTPVFGDDPAQFFPESSLPQLPPIPCSPSPPPISTIIEPSSDSTTSKKQKTRDDVDPTNVVQGTRTCKAPKRYDL